MPNILAKQMISEDGRYVAEISRPQEFPDAELRLWIYDTTDGPWMDEPGELVDTLSCEGLVELLTLSCEGLVELLTLRDLLRRSDQ